MESFNVGDLLHAMMVMKIARLLFLLRFFVNRIKIQFISKGSLINDVQFLGGF